MDWRRRVLAAGLCLLVAFAAPAARAGDGEYEDFETESQLSDAETFDAAEPAPGPELAPVAAKPATLQDRAVQLVRAAHGTWGFEFLWVKPDGSVELLSRHNPNTPLIPASTMKIFPGWLAFISDAMPLAELGDMLRFSRNGVADRLLTQVGGAAAVRTLIAGLGVPTRGALVVADGSGFSAKNRATAHLQVALLRHILETRDPTGRGKDYEGFKTLLAQPDVDGTLKSEGRLPTLAGALFAKTGTLKYTGVASLVGFIESPGRGTVVFSIMGNNIRRRKKNASQTLHVAREAVDAVIELHARHVGGRWVPPAPRPLPSIVPIPRGGAAFVPFDGR